ncbi:MAG: hypothetical protein PHT31_01775 [Candidatus Omnitrophica bacterium]|nr:hypothetical protein [Candidatus Omnitrophota bacterium]
MRNKNGDNDHFVIELFEEVKDIWFFRYLKLRRFFEKTLLGGARPPPRAPPNPWLYQVFIGRGAVCRTASL